MRRPVIRIREERVLLACTIVALALVTVHLQVTALHVSFLETEQVKRHVDVLNGTAANPWQYRVLAEWVVEGASRFLSGAGVARPTIVAFIVVRVLQNAAVLLAAHAYYRQLSISPLLALIGLNLLAFAMATGDLESDLSFNTYFDLLFYLLAATAVLDGRWWSVVTLAGLASLNRETGALIPFMPFAALPSGAERRRALAAVAAGVLLFGVLFVALRVWYGPRPLILGWEHPRGIPLFLFNMRRYGWVRLVAFFGSLPLIALAGYRGWPRELQRLGLLILPIWFLAHAFASVITETRLFLVPLAVVILPACLILAGDQDGESYRCSVGR